MLIAQTMRHEKFDRLPKEPVAGVSKQRFRLGIYQDNLPSAVHHDYRIGSELDKEPESLLAHLSLRDVLDEAVVAHQSPFFIVVRNDLVAHPANASVSMENPVFDRTSPAICQGLCRVLPDQFTVIRINHSDPEIRIVGKVRGSITRRSQAPHTVGG